MIDAKNEDTGQGMTVMLMPLRGTGTGKGNLPDPEPVTVPDVFAEVPESV